MWKDFKEFAMKGNVLDLAIAVVIGGAFGKIVTSLVENIIMPLVGMLTGGIDLTNSLAFGPEDSLKIGVFIQSIIDFLIISFSIFMALRVLTKLNRKKKEETVEEPAEPELDPKEELLKEIRDLLKKEQA
ncbi:large conductance mechanosensitive channel [Lysinibacillus composti]|uniref:Large-conductance mechanosensitive channel n=1 Tax=Lysinibacillus composti TaxID=720633 RepID=A0A3N9ULQ9_9BACI|nr:large conductance mechanosensitive channel protein MscL [Lysinibacillus composti]MBM7609943.1 large conductance mechanosensitive channel [Lysinibacillus composti]RQW73472.1 large conductance mechanosensitive channel protein MscL [Lysinibacillus composti]